MKILFISNISKGVGSFSLASILAAKELGIEYHYAANYNAALPGQPQNDEIEYGDKCY